MMYSNKDEGTVNAGANAVDASGNAVDASGNAVDAGANAVDGGGGNDEANAGANDWIGEVNAKISGADNDEAEANANAGVNAGANAEPDKIYSNNPSICIPRVFNNISTKFIIKIFQHKLKIGPIKKVDVIYNHIKDDDDSKWQFKKVFIHFHNWNENKDDIRTLINEGKTLKVVYDIPWFWICSLNRSKRSAN